MKKLMSLILVFTFAGGVLFGGLSGKKRVNKVLNNKPMLMKKREPLPSLNMPDNHPSFPITIPSWESPRSNSSNFALVDSSTNGFGMVVGVTRPIITIDDNWFFVYRQYAGVEGTTHGQLGGAFSEDGEDWTAYFNLNANGNPPWGGGGFPGDGGAYAQARYPSAMGNADYPYAIWNEYTALGGTPYGGHPYYTYDEFEWGGGSFAYPLEVDQGWDDIPKDLWVGSPEYSTDGSEHYFNVVYNDWTRSDRWLFHSEGYDDGYIVFGEEIKIIDEMNHLEPGDAGGSYNSSAGISMSNSGHGMVGLIGLFAGGLDDLSSVTNYHTAIFKLTEDYGETWHGPGSDAPPYEQPNYYFIPDNVWLHMVANYFAPEYLAMCPGDTAEALIDMWTYYEFDMRVDSEGNPHITMEVLPCGENYCYYRNSDGSNIGAGYYHFTIDKDYIGNPGFVNTPTGWNYSQVLDARESWVWADPTGSSLLWSTQGQIAISEDDPDVIWIVSDQMVQGPEGGNYDPGDPYDCDAPYEVFYESSEDILVFKSTDNGATWWNPLNATPTPDPIDYGNGEECPEGTITGWCSPEEQWPHTAHWATNDRVNIAYQMPNWYHNEIGDMSGADHLNRVYAGWAEFTSNSEPPYPGGGASTSTITVDNQAGWNLVGLPVEVEDTGYETLFPNSVANTLYAFGVGYEPTTELALGEGYWLRFDDAGSNELTGGTVDNLLASLAEGWNLVSGGSNECGIDDPNGIVVPNTLYGFGVGYEPASSLQPGSGYWLRTDAAGDVTFTSTGAARVRPFTDRMKDANSISFNGNAIYFGVEVPDNEKLSYSLPPKPQAGSFDVRFAGDWKYTESSGIIELMNNTDMISVQFSIKDGSEWILESASGKVILNGNGEIQIVNSDSYSLYKGSVSRTPETFALHQGYPNPFNPETTISYDISNVGNVEIVVYDMMGREIKTLVSGYHTPSTYQVVWNGTDNRGKIVPSGVYFYRMNSSKFTQVNKVMFLK